MAREREVGSRMWRRRAAAASYCWKARNLISPNDDRRGHMSLKLNPISSQSLTVYLFIYFLSPHFGPCCCSAICNPQSQSSIFSLEWGTGQEGSTGETWACPCERSARISSLNLKKNAFYPAKDYSPPPVTRPPWRGAPLPQLSVSRTARGYRGPRLRAGGSLPCREA